jgi:hypothetical protein
MGADCLRSSTRRCRMVLDLLRLFWEEISSVRILGNEQLNENTEVTCT